MITDAAPDRLTTGIDGLDSMLGGGLLARSAVLVEGAPGTGKTTLAMQFLMAGAQRGEAGLFVSFEEFPAQLYADAAELGWNLRDLESRGLLRIVFTDPSSLLHELESVDSALTRDIQEFEIRRVVVDSLSHYEQVSTDPFELRDLEFRLVSSFKREGLTSILLRENASLLGETRSPSRAPFLVDAVLLLRYVEIDSAIERALLVLKMRGSRHATDIRRYRVDKGGLVVEQKFEGREGILGGAPRKSKIDAFVQAFGRGR